MPDGIFPSEDWLRKRGKYANCPGPQYNTLAIRVNQWLGGARNLRKLLGHAHASTTAWTPENVIAAWRNYEDQYGISPSQAKGTEQRRTLTRESGREADKIYDAARRHGVLAEARNGRNARIKWTPERALAEWKTFCKTNGRTPSECMSSKQRKKLSRALTAEATRIYDAVRRLGLLNIAREAAA